MASQDASGGDRQPAPRPAPKPLSPWAKAALGLTQSLLAPMTAIIGGLWVVLTYVDGQHESRRKENETRRLEAQRPFLEKQLALYFETAQVTGKLIVLTPDDKNWPETEKRFWALYWSELSMVEDSGVEEAMVKFSRQLIDYTTVRKSQKDHNQAIDDMQLKGNLEGAALDLAHAIRASIETRWSGRSQLEPPN